MIELYGWIVAMGLAVSTACALLGCFLVLRRMALLGDAVSHAVLPGIAIAFLLSGSRHSFWMMLGASLAGFLAAALIEWVYRNSPVKQDASIGIVFTAMFAIGVVLIALYADRVDLDQECVLYGEIAFVPLQERVLGMPGPVLRMGVVALLVAGAIALFYKELLVTSFDPGLAWSLGIPPSRYHYALMGALALTVVNAFEAVGAILVVAMLILPAASAYLLTDRLPTMLGLSVLHAALSTCLGVAAAVQVDCSIAGAMVVAGALLFLLAFLFSPRHGVLPRMLRRFLLARRTAEENLLALLGKEGPRTLEEAGAGVARRLEARGLLRRGDRLELTEAGQREAKRVIRAHRLWEAYMASVMDIPPDHLHDTAHALEHVLDPELLDRIDERLGHPGRDPHGSDIPPGRV
ncbi:MAG: metal ABC transporter permease [Candidatus Eremiobacterota bacterium]